MKVTTPQEAREIRATKNAADVARLVSIVEVALLDDRPEHWIDIRSFSPSSVQYVESLYAVHGWRTRIEHDQRDGDALVLAEQ